MADTEIYDLIAFGRSCVDFTYLVEPGQEQSSKAPIMKEIVSGGGQAATSAVIVSLLGGNSAYVGNLGWDDGGMLLLKEFRRFGVDCRWVERPHKFLTPKAIVIVDPLSGHRKIYYQPKQDHFSCPLPEEAIKQCKTLILDPEISLEDLQKVKNWKKPESLVIYDAERRRPALDAMKEFADFFIASETILDINSKISREIALKNLLQDVSGELVITFGENGSIWWKDKIKPIHIPSIPFNHICDTTGAGDVFHASFAYFYPQSKDMILALKCATYCASLSTTLLGTRQKVNYKEELERTVHKIKETDLNELPRWLLQRNLKS